MKDTFATILYLGVFLGALMVLLSLIIGGISMIVAGYWGFGTFVLGFGLLVFCALAASYVDEVI